MREKEDTVVRILVVDDAATDRALAGTLVKDAGWEVTFAEDGEQALAQIEQAAPNAVLTDLRMPKLDGLQLVEQVRRSHPRIPVILMTSYGSQEIAAKALRIGAVSYIPKDSLVKELAVVLHDVLATSGCGLKSVVRTEFAASESTFQLGYETNSLASLVVHLQQGLAQLGFDDEADLIRVGTALAEALNNAVNHGNLELDSEMRETDDRAYNQLREVRIRQQPYCDRRVHVIQRLTSDEAVYVIRDEGAGFDPSKLPDPTDPENLMKVGGRGMLLIRTFMDEVRFNSTGNEITMIKRRQQL